MVPRSTRASGFIESGTVEVLEHLQGTAHAHGGAIPTAWGMQRVLTILLPICEITELPCLHPAALHRVTAGSSCVRMRGSTCCALGHGRPIRWKERDDAGRSS